MAEIWTPEDQDFDDRGATVRPGWPRLDLDPARPAIEGFHVDENEDHLGLVARDKRPKPGSSACAIFWPF